MWDQWAFPVAGTRFRRLSYRCSIYGMDIRVSRYGWRWNPAARPAGPRRRRGPDVSAADAAPKSARPTRSPGPAVASARPWPQPVREMSVPVPENRRPVFVAVTLSSLMVDGSPSIARS